jgi:hypothetical protein
MQASCPVELMQASVPYYSIEPAEADVVVLSSSDTKEALDFFLSLSPVHGLSSRLSGGNTQEPSSSSGSYLL